MRAADTARKANGLSVSRLAILSALAIVTGCLVGVGFGCGGNRVPPPPPQQFVLRPVQGSREDVHTEPGAKQGYEVYFGCKRFGHFESSGIYVGSLGHTPFPDPLDLDQLPQFWSVCDRIVAATHASSAFGKATASCRLERTGCAVLLSDWREIDGAMRAVGEWLASHNYRGEVLFDVEQQWGGTPGMPP